MIQEHPVTADDERVVRLIADLANVRRRRDEQIERARTEERVAGARRLAEVYDDLVRSLAANPDRQSPWYRGHIAILDRLERSMTEAGVTEVGRSGERFDPSIHEAIGLTAGPDGTVVAVPRAGFVLDDGTLVRAAQVLVGGG